METIAIICLFLLGTLFVSIAIAAITVWLAGLLPGLLVLLVTFTLIVAGGFVGAFVIQVISDY